MEEEVFGYYKFSKKYSGVDCPKRRKVVLSTQLPNIDLWEASEPSEYIFEGKSLPVQFAQLETVFKESILNARLKLTKKDKVVNDESILKLLIETRIVAEGVDRQPLLKSLTMAAIRRAIDPAMQSLKVNEVVRRALAENGMEGLLEKPYQE